MGKRVIYPPPDVAAWPDARTSLKVTLVGRLGGTRHSRANAMWDELWFWHMTAWVERECRSRRGKHDYLRGARAGVWRWCRHA
jgi:hypothetical protein